jgi:response regulator RpfG family c-di-GMP phosphodiesterase
MSISVSTPTRCFLIDDDLDDQEIFFMALQQFDESIQCDFANDAATGIENLKADGVNVPHCIFIDMNMPRMDGVECLERIKKMDHVRNIPVCMFSTSADPVSVARTKELGAIDFIVKPADISVLSEMIGQFFKRNVRRDE